jgi:dephospho-CoA kinase
MSTTDPNKQNLKKSIEMADFILLNNGTKEDLIRQVEKVLDQIC